MCRDFFLGSIRPKYYLRGSCPVLWEQGEQLCVIYQEDLGSFLRAAHGYCDAGQGTPDPYLGNEGAGW